MSKHFDPKEFLDIILKAAGLSPSAPSPSAGLQAMGVISPAGRALSQLQPKSFPVAKKKIPFSGIAGYSEKGAPEDWDTAMGEVYGYRWWYLVLPPELVGYIDCTPRMMTADKQVGTLYGANNQPWHDGRLEARCTSYRGLGTSGVMNRTNEPHQPPETREACGCGFWAYFNKGLEVSEVLSMQFAGSAPHLLSYGAAIPVFGVVKGTGRVIIGEKGFRCQYAQIMGLCLPPVAINQLRWWLPISIYDTVYTDVPLDRENCSEAELMIRLSQLEAILSDGYPSARLFTSQELLTQYFPPDKNYA